jgi:hypothetical protein
MCSSTAFGRYVEIYITAIPEVRLIQMACRKQPFVACGKLTLTWITQNYSWWLVVRRRSRTSAFVRCWFAALRKTELLGRL